MMRGDVMRGDAVESRCESTGEDRITKPLDVVRLMARDVRVHSCWASAHNTPALQFNNNIPYSTSMTCPRTLGEIRVYCPSKSPVQQPQQPPAAPVSDPAARQSDWRRQQQRPPAQRPGCPAAAPPAPPARGPGGTGSTGGTWGTWSGGTRVGAGADGAGAGCTGQGHEKTGAVQKAVLPLGPECLPPIPNAIDCIYPAVHGVQALQTGAARQYKRVTARKIRSKRSLLQLPTCCRDWLSACSAAVSDLCTPATESCCAALARASSASSSATLACDRNGCERASEK